VTGTTPGPDTVRRRRAYRGGRTAERLAAAFLRLKGYRILARHYQAGGGEIDIVARRGDTVAFVEVKIRPSLDEALLAITPAKRRRMAQAARAWLTANPWAMAVNRRGDAVCLAPWRPPRHLTAVIELDLP
jgi:putative endonuclease